HFIFLRKRQIDLLLLVDVRDAGDVEPDRPLCDSAAVRRPEEDGLPRAVREEHRTGRPDAEIRGLAEYLALDEHFFGPAGLDERELLGLRDENVAGLLRNRDERAGELSGGGFHIPAFRHAPERSVRPIEKEKISVRIDREAVAQPELRLHRDRR